ncbi:MAG: glycoside hydrolase family 127 protein [Clostridia bacterium]|nr:glycoside hydrolase family 127 protein [Clostridia bacterium]
MQAQGRIGGRSMTSSPLSLRQVRVEDGFWKGEMELVRTTMIPYQWEALNDNVADAAPSFCMHNFRAAARLQKRRSVGEADGLKRGLPFAFETVPERGQAPEADRFYGFVFQDSDLYKWLEAVAYQLMQHPDEKLQATAQEAADLVCAAQEADGYLDTFYILRGREGAFSNLRDCHEMYCLGHLTEAAVAWYLATGRRELMDAAGRFADCVAEHIGPEEGKKHGYPGHEIAEMALIRLYEATGEERYLRQARYFILERGKKPNYFALERNRALREEGKIEIPEEELIKDFAYHQAHMPVLSQREAVGHAVRAMYLYSGMADLARLDGDDKLLEACETLWQSTTQEKMYVTGGVGATHIGEAFSRPFDLPNDAAYAETCASVGLVFFARRMLQMQAKGEYADVMERALLNGVLSGMALDGKSFFYVNPLSVEPEACRTDKRLEHVKPVRQKWFSCACCPPNVARLLSSLPQYAVTQGEDTVFVHLYLGMEIETELGGNKLKLHVSDGWLRGETVIEVETDGETAGTIAVRLPGWSKESRATADGHEAKVKDGYAYFTGTWKNGDRIVVSTPMAPVVLQADSRVREDAGKVCVQYGPFVLCLEEKDNGDSLHMLRIDAADPAFEVTWENIGALRLPRVTANGFRRCEKRQKSLYSAYEAPVEERVRLTFVPYFAWGNRAEGEMSVWVRA